MKIEKIFRIESVNLKTAFFVEKKLFAKFLMTSKFLQFCHTQSIKYGKTLNDTEQKPFSSCQLC